jgi:ATP-binding cassette subfamily C protein
MPSINRILTAMTEIRHRTALVESVHRDFQEGKTDLKAVSAANERSAIPFDREIEFRGVHYTYNTDEAQKAVLRDISFTLAKGEAIGVVGPSGAGKSTLIDVFLCLLRPQEGQLLIDGADAFANPRSWQEKLGYVPQEIYLMDDTLRHNIAFGVDDSDIDEERLRAVVGMARLDGFIAELPEGYHTVLGERGVRLSGGQRQRIGIARALYQGPEVLVFDEATSALDNETEREISQAIQALAGDKTLIIIAHRLSTVRMCDKLVFMQDGRIAEIGSFDQLMKNNPAFRRMAQAGGQSFINGDP